MRRADFDAANDVPTRLANTFLARVPDLVLAGMSIPDAIIDAKRQDDACCELMLGVGTYAQQQAATALREAITERVYA